MKLGCSHTRARSGLTALACLLLLVSVSCGQSAHRATSYVNHTSPRNHVLSDRYWGLVYVTFTPESLPSILSWMGEVAAFAQVLTHTGTLKTIQDQGRKRGEVGHTHQFLGTFGGLGMVVAHPVGIFQLSSDGSHSHLVVCFLCPRLSSRWTISRSASLTSRKSKKGSSPFLSEKRVSGGL